MARSCPDRSSVSRGHARSTRSEERLLARDFEQDRCARRTNFSKTAASEASRNSPSLASAGHPGIAPDFSFFP